MKMLLTVRRLRIAMGLPDTDEINELLEETLGSTTVILEGTIRTQSFERRTVTDVFYVQSSLEFGPTLVRRHVSASGRVGTANLASVAKLKLSHGFVDTAVNFTAFASATLNGLDDASLRTDLEATASGTDVIDFANDGEPGILRITDFSLSRCYVSVTYTCGFTDDMGTPPVFTSTPTWLTEAAKLSAMIDLSDHPLISRTAGGEGSERSREREQQRNQKLLDQIMLSHSRYVPMRDGQIRKTTFTAL